MEKTFCIIQTNRGSSQTYERLAAEVLPEVKAIQIIDDSLLAAINSDGHLTPTTARRLYSCYLMAQEMGADAIFHACVVASDAADLIAPFVDIPVIRIDEAAARKAIALGDSIAVIAKMPAALEPSAGHIKRLAQADGKSVTVELISLADLVEMEKAGDGQRAKSLTHERLMEAAARNDVLYLAQPGMASMVEDLQDCPVPISVPGRDGFELLRERLGL